MEKEKSQPCIAESSTKSLSRDFLFDVLVFLRSCFSAVDLSETANTGKLSGDRPRWKAPLRSSLGKAEITNPTYPRTSIGQIPPNSTNIYSFNVVSWNDLISIHWLSKKGISRCSAWWAGNELHATGFFSVAKSVRNGQVFPTSPKVSAEAREFLRALTVKLIKIED